MKHFYRRSNSKHQNSLAGWLSYCKECEKEHHVYKERKKRYAKISTEQLVKELNDAAKVSALILEELLKRWE